MLIMEYTPQEVWSLIKDRSKEYINPRSYDAWIHPTNGIAMSEDILIVETRSKFAADYIHEHFGVVLEKSACAVLDRKVLITFKPSEKNGRMGPPPPPPEAPPKRNRHNIILNPSYVFDNFVVGSSNQLAHAACLSVAQLTAKTWNPLFIYGGTGLGKTHLIHAIGNSVLARNSLSVFYGSAELFMNELIQSIQQARTSEFRNKYRNIDLLLIDDVHFLAFKEGTQEEFFHTFNALYENQKQIVLTSDRPPNEIPSLEERLVSRFAWGLVVDIQPPDFETRMAILRKRTERDNLIIPDDVLLYIAENVKSNVRDLESSLIRIIAYSSICGREITIEFARDVLKDILSREAKRVTVEKIMKVVSQHYGLSPETLKSKSRTQAVALARHTAIYITRELMNMPLVEIGENFGSRDHTTIIHSCEKITMLIEKDEETRKLVRKLSDLSKK
jgi:chromosomal replication initiator protein